MDRKGRQRIKEENRVRQRSRGLLVGEREKNRDVSFGGHEKNEQVKACKFSVMI